MNRPKLYLFVGYPGAGKTTVAKIIHELTGATHLWADKIRRERLGPPNYTHKENTELYNHLNELTGELLRAGNSVIFDTNFKFYKDREHLRQIASEHGADTVVVWLTTPKEEARHRATEPHHQKDTRLHGHMSPEDFERLSSGLEAPRPEEQAIRIDGTDINAEDIKQRLGLS
ncbi:MAG TPA: AAA family ATPase [Candidatus Saccharimonadales bacterium]|nr:AAA family ATPase [Candidatus Saccharimonadales bacterium]